MVFRTEDWVRPVEPDGRGQILEKEFVTKLGTKDEFAPLLWETIRAWRIDEAKEQTWLGDGSHWLWDLATLLLPNAKQVVDPYHVSEKIHETAKEVFGHANPFARQWAKRYYDGIWECGESGVTSLLTALEALKPKSKAAREKVDELHTYATNNRHRMAYDIYRKEGAPHRQLANRRSQRAPGLQAHRGSWSHMAPRGGGRHSRLPMSALQRTMGFAHPVTRSVTSPAHSRTHSPA